MREPDGAGRVEEARHDPKLANVVYHDWEAHTYDHKWSISFDQRCIDYATGRFRAVVPEGTPGRFGTALELGSGTGFFLLNLMQAGIIQRGIVTDVSANMVATALDHAGQLGLDVTGTVAEAEQLPYEDDSVELVIAHAMLHHVPDVPAALAEVLRVLKPGGRLVFAGEPSRIGDRYARALGRLTWAAVTRVTQLPGLSAWRKPHTELHASSREAALEALVDLHTFDPEALARLAREAGAMEVRTVTEELTAAMLGWPVRTFEAAVPEHKLGPGWRFFAYRAWRGLSWVDSHLARVVPPKYFYNVLLTGVKPT